MSLIGRSGWLGLLCLGDKAREAWAQGREARMVEEAVKGADLLKPRLRTGSSSRGASSQATTSLDRAAQRNTPLKGNDRAASVWMSTRGSRG